MHILLCRGAFIYVTCIFLSVMTHEGYDNPVSVCCVLSNNQTFSSWMLKTEEDDQKLANQTISRDLDIIETYVFVLI